MFKKIVGQVFNSKMNHVANGVYIGDWDASVDFDLLLRKQIRQIICINEKEKIPQDLERYQLRGIDHRMVDCADTNNAPLHKQFTELYCLIEYNIKAGRRVLIHCTAGASRSAAVVVMWLMCHYRLKYHDAFNWLKSKRWKVCINPGFVSKLLYLEKSSRKNPVAETTRNPTPNFF